MLDGDAPQITPDVRSSVARLVALYFVVHLQAELLKPDAILLKDYENLPVRKINEDILDRVRVEFRIPEDEALPKHNFIQRWCEINGKFDYENSSFVLYNRILLPRLLDLRDGTPASQDLLFGSMRAVFQRIDYEKQGLTVSFFLYSESVMRELLRYIVWTNLNQGRAADYLVLLQSSVFQMAISEYFEGVVQEALAENVRLLNGILPQQVAEELKQNGFVEPVLFNDVAVLFTDFESFSESTQRLSPAEVLHRLDKYFTEFDRISAGYGLERIKTIGDSYMAVAGAPAAHHDPVGAACDAALEIVEASNRISGPDGWKIRVGIHAGPLVAGVIGKQKFSYDVWGATVNFASRMESSGAPGRINVSAEVHRRVQSRYRWEARGPQPVKRLGTAEMYFLLGKAAID